MTHSQRSLLITTSVVLLHGAGIWALQNGLLRRAVEIVVPASILVSLVEPPTPQVASPPPAKAPVAQPNPKPVEKPRTAARPAPLPIAITDNAPAPNAPTGVLNPQPTAAPVIAQTAVAPTAPSPATAPPGSVKLELPSSNAEYLNNPKPHYPPISKRLGEQGKVIVRILIDTDGLAQKAEVRSSSGYDRLDEAAMSTVLGWRYIPGKRNGVVETMWFNIPINFVLE